MRQFVLTPAMGKRLIGKGMAVHPAIQSVLRSGTLVIVAGTTNGYVAEEILRNTGQLAGFTRMGFRRGTVMAPGFDPRTVASEFSGDVVLVDGKWQPGKTIYDVGDSLKAGDVILKGGNAVDAFAGKAAVLIGDPQAGTAGIAVRAVMGRRVRLIVPIGLEKRVMDDIDDLAEELNGPEASGPRLLPLPGMVFTELDAINHLTGAKARLVSAGGIYGAEGALWISVTGPQAQVDAAASLIQEVQKEPPCQV